MRRSGKQSSFLWQLPEGRLARLVWHLGLLNLALGIACLIVSASVHQFRNLAGAPPLLLPAGVRWGRPAGLPPAVISPRRFSRSLATPSPPSCAASLTIPPVNPRTLSASPPRTPPRPPPRLPLSLLSSSYLAGGTAA